MRKLEDCGVSELGALVDEVAANLATSANNNGWHGQVEFLTIIAGLSEEEIIDALERG